MEKYLLVKHKIFFWPMLNDRLNTRELLRMKNMDLPYYKCIFCMNTQDGTIHLFLYCPFVQQCWQTISLHIPMHLSPLEIVEDLKLQIAKPIFMEIIILF